MKINLDPAKAAFVKALLKDREGTRRMLLDSQRAHWRRQREAAHAKLTALESDRRDEAQVLKDLDWQMKRSITLKWASLAESRCRALGIGEEA